MSENLVLHESEQKETDCIQKNLDHKINRYTVMQPFSEHKNSKYMIVYLMCMCHVGMFIPNKGQCMPWQNSLQNCAH